MTKLGELLQELPPDLQRDVEDFVRFFAKDAGLA